MRPMLMIALALIWKDGWILISRRRSDQHLGGLWEFPGGKCEAGESPEACAVREALEEVGITCVAEATRQAIVHEYAERTVHLIPVDCRYLSGDAYPLCVDEARWVLPAELAEFEFPDANHSLLAELTRI